jgi:hypothetical protein
LVDFCHDSQSLLGSFILSGNILTKMIIFCFK